MDVLPATPVPTTVKDRARARLTELRNMHGWTSQSPITISKPKSGGTERAREAMNKRMRNLGFFEVADARGFSTAKALAEELDFRVFTESNDKRDYKKLIEEMKQEQASRNKQFWDEMAMVKQRREESEQLTERIEKHNEATTQRLAKEEGELEVKMRAEMAAKLEEARAELRSEFAIDRDKAMGELHKEYLASRLCSEAFNKCVARCVELKTGPLKAQIARLQDQAKPQPKPNPQPGVATLHKQIATLKEENRALAAKVTKIASLKRARTMQHDRRSRFRDKDNDQENTESPAEKKRDTRNSSSSTTVDNK